MEPLTLASQSTDAPLAGRPVARRVALAHHPLLHLDLITSHLHLSQQHRRQTSPVIQLEFWKPGLGSHRDRRIEMQNYRYAQAAQNRSPHAQRRGPGKLHSPNIPYM